MDTAAHAGDQAFGFRLWHHNSIWKSNQRPTKQGLGGSDDNQFLPLRNIDFSLCSWNASRFELQRQYQRVIMCFSIAFRWELLKQSWQQKSVWLTANGTLQKCKECIESVDVNWIVIREQQQTGVECLESLGEVWSCYEIPQEYTYLGSASMNIGSLNWFDSGKEPKERRQRNSGW